MPPGARPAGECQNWWPDCTGTGGAKCVGRPCGVDGIDSDAPGGMVDIDPSDLFAERALGNLSAQPASAMGLQQQQQGQFQARPPGSREWPGGTNQYAYDQNPYGDPGDPGTYAANYDGTTYVAGQEKAQYGAEPYDQYGAPVGADYWNGGDPGGPQNYPGGPQYQNYPGGPQNYPHGNGDVSYQDPRDMQGQSAAPQQPPPAARPVRQGDSDTWLRCVGAALELMKSVSWFLQLWKLIESAILINDPVITPLVALNFALATVLQLQKPFDQIMLVIASQNRYHRYGFQSLGPVGLCCSLACCPLSIPLIGLSNMTLKIYGLERTYHYEPGDLLVFAHRPLSTVFLGLPVANIMSMLSADRALVLHPVQVHIRAMQSVYQMFFEYLVTIIIDLVAILSATISSDPLSPQHTVFWVSLCYAACSVIVNCGVVSIVTVRAEKVRMQKRTHTGAYAPGAHQGAVPSPRDQHREFANTPPHMLPGHGTGF